MICYKDRTFCASEVKEHTCGREITEEELKHAQRIGLPIAYGNFCDKPTPLSSIDKTANKNCLGGLNKEER